MERPELVRRAKEVAASQLAARAAEVDSGEFPAQNLKALHEAGLMGVFLPARFGGPDATVRGYAEIAAVLGEECASTAMIWAMHGQQVAALVDHAIDSHAAWLELVAGQGCLIGSVTTDREGGADLMTTGAALVPEGGKLRLRREAPVVTGGCHASFYLVTMRASPDSGPTQTRLVCVSKDDVGEITETGTWDALGMRGTHSVPMRFDVLIDGSRVLAANFADVARQTMIPVGHVGWAASWLGVARGAFNRVCAAIRAGQVARGSPRSDLVFAKLAGARLSLDLLESIIMRAADETDRFRGGRRRGEDCAPVDPILINNVKLAGAQLAFDAVDQLIDLAGMAEGYRRGRRLALERAFRDLRSAALMFHDDRLRMANGRLVLAPSLRVAAGSAGPAGPAA